jgi:hypothetical protein
VFSHSFSSPVLTLFLVLCFLPHAQFFLTDVHPHFEPTFRLMFSISCPFFSLIAVHPQFEPIFGPLFSVSYPVWCCPQSVKKTRDENSSNQKTGDNEVMLIGNQPHFEPIFGPLVFLLMPSLMLPTKCQQN